MNSSLMMHCYEIIPLGGHLQNWGLIVASFSIVFNGTTATAAVRSRFVCFEKAG